MTSAFTRNNIKYQLVPPEVHRRNAAERAIQTWKHHFIAGLSTLDPTFPISEWDRLIQQGEITLNLLRNSRVNPNLSAWAYLFGQFDYNSTPLAPPGTKLIVHLKPHKRASWDPHGIPGFYTGPAMRHYRCYTVYIPKTRTTRITDTVTFLPSVLPISQFSVQDHLQQSLDDIIHILQTPQNSHRLTAGDTTRNAIRLVAEILKRSTSRHSQMYDDVAPHFLDKILSHYQQKITPEKSLPVNSRAPLPRVSHTTIHKKFPPVSPCPQKMMTSFPRVQNAPLQHKIPTTCQPTLSTKNTSFSSP